MPRQWYHAFIRYCVSAVDFAWDLYERLVQQRFSLWLDSTWLEQRLKWHEEIEQGCESSRVILPVSWMGVEV